MKFKIASAHTKLAVLGMAVVALSAAFPKLSDGQDLPPQRQIRAYIPPDQLVSMLPSTPFDRFLEFVDPIFQRVTGKQVVDPEGRTSPIGVSIASMHFLDAFELVLQYNGLVYRETDRFFIVEQAPAGEVGAIGAGAPDLGGAELLPANKDTREIQINAILFELNHSKVRSMGLNWSVFLGGGQGGQGGGQGGGQSGGGNRSEFFLKTDDIFDGVEDYVRSPEEIPFSDLKQFFQLAETQGVGETIAQPQVTVQSGEQGTIQIGSDIPVQVRDFAGNTVTQFFSTGIIIDVTPTLVKEATADTAGAPVLEFVHLDVKVEKSGSTPSVAGIIIDRNTANTQVLLLDGEQTVIGGLYSTEESVSRAGVPFLKDLPPWFFGIRYLFGKSQRTTNQKELLIVLQAELIDGLESRARRRGQVDLLERNRREVEEAFDRFNRRVGDSVPDPTRFREPIE
ncbi:MAG: type II and III secretion system protein [Rhodothermia bacterium]|nr:type II and III secretion system protein [Rhodothermia bacterium]